MRHIPDSWPGTREPPSFGGLHVAPYTIETASWLNQAMTFVCGTKMDARKRRTCISVLCHMIAHIETGDSLQGGRPFVCVSKTQLSEELHVKRRTVASAIETLTAGGWLRIIWEPSRGQRDGTCYRFAYPDMADNATDLGSMSGTHDMADNATDLGSMSGTHDMVPNSSDMVPNSSDMVPNSSVMADNPTDLGATLSLSQSLKEGRRRERRVDGTTPIIDTHSSVSRADYERMKAQTSGTLVPGRP